MDKVIPLSVLSERTAGGIAARAAVMDRVFDTVGPKLMNLYERWMDEREYEDFSGYVEVMKGLCERAKCEWVRANKKPFGFIMKLQGFPYAVQFYVSNRELGWKAVKLK